MDYWSDDDEDGDEGGRPWKRIALVVAAVLALGAIGYTVLKKDDGSSAVSTTESTTTESTTTEASTDSGPEAPTTSTLPASDAPVATGSGTGSTVSPSNPDTTAPNPSTDAPASVAPATSPPVATEASTTPTTAAAPAPPSGPSYATLPDGSPAPLIAIFDADKVTLSGAVPSEATKQRLEELALINSRVPVPIESELTIDPTVPIGIGVRVIELTSSRFEQGSAAIVGEHAAEFDRVVTVLASLPNVTALVIGHADQVGSEDANYKLSAERAAAVVDYMVASGISPARLASRAVGDTDLLTLNNDAASLALNRRTEFVLYGLLDG